MAVLGIQVDLRNDSGGAITMGTLTINPAATARIWDTTAFVSSAQDNFEQVLVGIAVFNEEISSTNLVMVVNTVDQSAADAFAQFHELSVANNQLNDSKDSFAGLRADAESTLGLSLNLNSAGDFGGNNITNVGNVDGRDVSTDGTNLDNHIASTANPHSTDIGNLGSGTLAELNAAVSDATLDDAGDPRDPNAHAGDHVLGGSDEIDGDELDVDFTPSNYTPTTGSPGSNADHLAAHLRGVDNALAGGGGNKIYLHLGMLNQANSTLGFFSMANNTNMTATEVTTSNGDPGINNGGIQPICLPACTLTRALITFGQAAVSGGSQDATKTLRIEMFRANYSNRTSLANLDFQVTTSVGVNNNLGGSSFTTGLELSGLSVAVAQGELIGFQFTNQSGSGNINGLGRAFLMLEFDVT